MKRVLVVLAVLVVLGLAAAGAAAWWAWGQVDSPYRGFAGDAAMVVVEPGTPSVHILDQLERRGVIVDSRLARLYMKLVLGDPPLQAGEYRFEGAAPLPQVLDKLVRGDVVDHAVTIVEGLTLEETAEALADAGFGEHDALLAAMRDPAPIADLDPEAETLEGYLFPSTYRFRRGTSEEEVVHTMVATFRRAWENEIEPLLAELEREAGGGEGPRRSVRELVTLASLVEKEAKIEEERPQIAAVYANRLEVGMGLYADPTVIFALKQEGRWDGNIRREDLRMDSPYNTYRHAGLPPGPIASPGLASLKAAARPADITSLYFVSRNDGSHVFADTLAEHNRNVDRWQRRYWRDQRRREAAAAPRSEERQVDRE